MNKFKLNFLTGAKVVKNKQNYIISKTHGKDVLDVGVVGQLNQQDSANWLHGRIKKVAKSLVGVDIDLDSIEKLNRDDYNIIHVSDLDESLLFDVVVIGDVIEHVDNVRQFLEFYISKCKSGGCIVISTPNPQNIELFFDILISKIPAVNAEHTNYIDPQNLQEQTGRIDHITIEEFVWINFIKRKGFKWIIFHPICRMLATYRRYYYPSYAALLRVK
jgi:2-polyprenyl-3-methyl-5-hydroxy-6-metoxy-1,4-benzoquinol methylase